MFFSKTGELNPKESEFLAWFMAYGETHIDESGRRLYPSTQFIVKTISTYSRHVDYVVSKGYLTYRMGDVLYPTPRADVWWTTYQKRAIRRNTGL